MVDKKRIAIYVRVSSQDQKNEGLSIEVQTKKLQDYSEVKDYWVFKIYTDAGISAGSINRPAFKDMMGDAKNEKFDAILVYKLDRFSRNMVDMIYTLNDLNNYNVDFISLTESFDTTTAVGRAFMKIISIFSELEREQTMERVEMVFSDKREQGLPSIPPPFGYKYNKKKCWVLEKKRADIVNQVYSDYKNKINFKESLKRLKIDRNCYYRILNNIKKGTYFGWVVYNKKIKDVRGKVIRTEEVKYKGTHEPILNDKTN